VTDVSDDLTASVIVVKIPEDSHIHTRRRENLKLNQIASRESRVDVTCLFLKCDLNKYMISSNIFLHAKLQNAPLNDVSTTNFAPTPC
jgi:hypothetical protein